MAVSVALGVLALVWPDSILFSIPVLLLWLWLRGELK